MLGTASVTGLVALATVWLPPGVPPLSKLRSSLLWVLAAAVMLGAAAQVRWMVDVTEDRRNSFPAADQRLLGTLRLPLLVIVHLAPRIRALPTSSAMCWQSSSVQCQTYRLRRRPSARFLDRDRRQSHGEVEYVYGNRSDISRSTSPREILPLLYALAGVSPPAPTPGSEYPGYPLVASADAALFWFFGGLPLLIVLCWWWIRRRLPSTARSCTEEVHRDRKEHQDVCRFSHRFRGFGATGARGSDNNHRFSSETVGAEPKALVPVVGIWRVENDNGKKVLAVDGRQWKRPVVGGYRRQGAGALWRALRGVSRSCTSLRLLSLRGRSQRRKFHGRRDHGALRGIVGPHRSGRRNLFNLKPNGDYLTIRANCLENNLVLWKFEKGKRSSVKWVRNTPTATKQWHELRFASVAPRSRAISTASSILKTPWCSRYLAASAYGPRPTAICTSATTPSPQPIDKRPAGLLALLVCWHPHLKGRGSGAAIVPRRPQARGASPAAALAQLRCGLLRGTWHRRASANASDPGPASRQRAAHVANLPHSKGNRPVLTNYAR